MNKIKASAPGKLMLLGEHSVVYNRPCLVGAINKRMTVELVVGTGSIESSFVKAVRKEFEKKYGKVKKGLIIEGFDSQYGLGSSAAVTVATALAMFADKGIRPSKKELFNFCYQIMLEVQGSGSGFDLAAAIWGGGVYFITGGKKIEPIKIANLPIVVGYTGQKADTVKLITQVKELKKIQGAKVETVFNQISVLVEKAKVCLQQEDWENLGDLMSQNHKLLQSIGVSCEKLDRLTEAAIKAGAWGAKLSGAGGGDCMIALVSEAKRQRVEEAIEAVGGEVLGLRFGEEGSRIEQ